MARKINTEIERFILESVEEHPRDLVALIAGRFEISRQAAHRHVSQLVEQGLLKAKGETSNRQYHLAIYKQEKTTCQIGSIAEDHIPWQQFFLPRLHYLPKNILGICEYGVTEMVNNAMDHSKGDKLELSFSHIGTNIRLSVQDDGIGIFQNIRESLKLADDDQVLLELTKGKLTTARDKHTGQGIFYTSRAFDKFTIVSGNLVFIHITKLNDWLVETSSQKAGTRIVMEISTFADRKLNEVFDEYADENSYEFTKTRIPLKLVTIGADSLISRSQAKRVLARFDEFETVTLDFSGVLNIGQAFADEIFRVFARTHPAINLIATNTTPEIDKMISRAKHTNL